MKPTVRRLLAAAAGALLLGVSVPVTNAVGATAAAPTPESIAAARTQLLGAGWNNPGIVRGRWISNTTWLMSYGGHVILHDSTIPANLLSPTESNGFVTMDQIIAARPEAILQDHNHFDQNRDAAQIASATGAPLVTTVSGCLQVKTDAISKGIATSSIHCDLLRDSQGRPFNALDSFFLPYGGEGLITTAYGTQGHPEVPIPGVSVTGVMIKHSVVRPYLQNLSGPNLHPDLSSLLKSPPSLSTLKNFGLLDDFEGGNLLYRVNYRGFTVVHHGSTGPTNSLEPGATAIKNSLKTLGDAGRIDLELGGIAELTYFLDGNGFYDSVQYSKAIGAKYYMPIHQSNWLPPVTNAAAWYYQPLLRSRATAASDPTFPKLCYTTEANWGTVWQFDLADWSGDRIGKPIPISGPGCYHG